MGSAEDRRDVKQTDWLGLMLAECSFAYLGWLNVKGNSKALWSNEPEDRAL
jgi:hypothetical protein